MRAGGTGSMGNTGSADGAGGGIWAWTGFALLLLLAPLMFDQGASISLLSQIATAMLLALSYNMLLGQGGMLSFGHAVYSGLGAFVAMHVLNRAVDGAWPVPVTLLPAVGGLGGAAVAVVLGFIAARQAGTAFSMITLGMAELIAAGTLMLPRWFGGEGGISGNRVIGTPFFGIDYGTPLQVYYLIAGWLLLSALAMYGFTRTPLGRIANAVRDNPERAEFIGYDARHVRYLTQIVSAFFAGIAGALAALNFEIASPENVGALPSATILLFTFIGGAGYFYGPMLGAAIGVIFSVLVARYSSAWQLYLGLFFMLIVMRAPNGVASLIAAAARGRREGRPIAWRRVLAASLSGLIGLAGLILLVELAYRRAAGSAYDTMLRVFGLLLDSARPAPWSVAALLLAAGVLGWRCIDRRPA
jgi:branched-chain amino acid transport system permease protein